MSWRGGISRIYYGLNKEVPDRELRFPVHKGVGTAGLTSDVPFYLKVPSGVEFVTVRLIYFDQTQSDVVRYTRSE